ncbi:DegT/DnrJ/EryC1/StrS family aminotransferase [Roseomonas sp. KE2513]|uniref:DegT/DnrJ/EryC1/StrS family aminotransferase n=1 Tax=Roseomonas sp. KE2513 TaxID=2479202 RepID=UPI0018DFCC63|nr:DegT/DnrJ/EryC1/StrS family aminotransferase [Roseomonas sp. KE2513]MBI0537350.1 DegT/DnrJ/EryC1/StrS family aminotransferase [Roseomonas sp. KE2513]
MNAQDVTVPQADLGAAYRAHKEAIDAAVARVLASGWYILGQEGAAFEREFAGWLSVGGPGMTAVGCANGTDAIALVLRGLGIGPGCTVATVSHTAVATVAAIEMVGATPLLIDIDPRTFCIDAAELLEVLRSPPPGLPPIRAVIPVHIYGHACDMDAIVGPCQAAGIAVVEDVAQAHGGRLHGRMLGTIGDAAAFSLYPTKNLGALGDAGITATSDAALATRMGAIRQYGWHRRYISDEPGVNSRLDEMQAAILRVRLPLLDAGNTRRREVAAAYDAALTDGPFAAPYRAVGVEHVFHQYVLRVPNREAVMERLRVQGVATAIHYPVPVHEQAAYKGRTALGPASCTETARAAGEVMSLPIFPEITDAQVERVCAALRSL